MTVCCCDRDFLHTIHTLRMAFFCFCLRHKREGSLLTENEMKCDGEWGKK